MFHNQRIVAQLPVHLNRGLRSELLDRSGVSVHDADQDATTRLFRHSRRHAAIVLFPASPLHYRALHRVVADRRRLHGGCRCSFGKQEASNALLGTTV